MFALLSTFLTCSETPFTYGKVAKVFGRVSVSCIWTAMYANSNVSRSFYCASCVKKCDGLEVLR